MVPLLRPLVAVTLALLLSGCFVEKDPEATAQEVADAPTASASGSSTSGAPANNSPQPGNLTFNATGLEVAFVLEASDPDGDALTWTLTFGDNASANGTFAAGAAANQSVEPVRAVQAANATHAYAQAGNYSVTLVVSDGKASANRTYDLTLAPAAAPQEPIRLEGSVVCLPTILVNGELAGDSQSFDVLAGQRTMTLTFDFGTGDVDDLDYTLTGPSGDATESAEGGPEPPMTVAAPAAGTWTLDVTGYSCAGEASYTMDVTFG